MPFFAVAVAEGGMEWGFGGTISVSALNSIYLTADLTGRQPGRMIQFIPWSFEPAGLQAT